MFGMNGWCKEPNNAGNGSDCPKNAQNSEDRTTGDLISRAAAIDEIKALYEWHDIVTEDRAIEHFKKLPSAQPERMRGRWIIKDNPGTGWYRVTCSECGEDVTSTAPCIGFYPNAKVTWDYCPNCGADMREVDDERV